MNLSRRGTVVLIICILMLSGKLAQMCFVNNNFKEILFKFIEKYLEDPKKDAGSEALQSPSSQRSPDPNTEEVKQSQE